MNRVWGTAKDSVERVLLPEPTRSSSGYGLVSTLVSCAFLLLLLLSSVLEGNSDSLWQAIAATGPLWWGASTLVMLNFLTWLSVVSYERHKALSALFRLAAYSTVFLFFVYLILSFISFRYVAAT